MRNYSRITAVSALTLALAACGGPAEEEEVAAPAAEEAQAAATEAEEAPEAEAAEEAEAATDEAAEEAADEEVAVEEEPAAEPEPVAVVSMDPPASFMQCGVCHAVEPGQHGIGPSLAGIAGRSSASVAGFTYSPAMRSAGLTWDDATLDRYLGDPAGVVPGTTMALPGIPEDQRAEIIAYLKTL